MNEIPKATFKFPCRIDSGNLHNGCPGSEPIGYEHLVGADGKFIADFNWEYYEEAAEAKSAYVLWAINNAMRLYEALEMVVNLCKHASKDAFSNGVTDNTGTIDEGDVRAGELIHQADEALRAAKEANQ